MKKVSWESIGKKIGSLDNKCKGQFLHGFACAIDKHDEGEDLDALADKVAKMQPYDKAQFFIRFAETNYHFYGQDLELEYLLVSMKLITRHKHTLKRIFVCLLRGGEQL